MKHPTKRNGYHFINYFMRFYIIYKALLSFLVVAISFSCKNLGKTPNVDAVDVSLNIKRFDVDLFSIDTLRMEKEIAALNKKYPDISPIFINHILGVDPPNAPMALKQFINESKTIYDAAKSIYGNIRFLEKDFTDAFKRVKYYFPKYPIPKIYTLLGPVDAFAQTGTGNMSPNFIGPDLIGINLQFYLGRNFPLYQQPFYIENVAPLYRSRRFSKEYIVSEIMQLIVDDLYQDKSTGKPLVEQMIEKGKQWWLLDRLLPNAADSVKTGYTQQQLNWCNQNEGSIWSYLIKNEDLYTIDNATMQMYIGEAPFTQVFGTKASPGNIGQWIGWQIIKKFELKKKNITINEVMQSSTQDILETSKYKPR